MSANPALLDYCFPLEATGAITQSFTVTVPHRSHHSELLHVESMFHQCWAKSRLRPDAVHAAQVQSKERYVPVSYTHLTLPTICSV
eukprot:10289418-Alexandrium_andersonii.AAC.1